MNDDEWWEGGASRGPCPLSWHRVQGLPEASLKGVWDPGPYKRMMWSKSEKGRDCFFSFGPLVLRWGLSGMSDSYWTEWGDHFWLAEWFGRCVIRRTFATSWCGWLRLSNLFDNRPHNGNQLCLTAFESVGCLERSDKCLNGENWRCLLTVWAPLWRF